MAGEFKKPQFNYEYDLDVEKENFDDFFLGPDRAIPEKAENEIDIATWNIANLGTQKRRPQDLELIAHILSSFELIAVQEVRAQIGHFHQIMEHLRPLGYRERFTDVAGAGERLAVVYLESAVEPGPLTGELDYNPNGAVENGEYVVKPKKQTFDLSGRSIETYFDNFNRNPFLTTWRVIDSEVSFMLANVHIYFGKKAKTDPDEGDEDQARFVNRVSEVQFLADWAHEMQKKKNKSKVYEQNIILIGDMNVPTIASDDPVYRALKRRGFVPTKYSTETGTTIKEFTKYDQIVFTNDRLNITEIAGNTSTVVDFDNFVFSDLWAQVEAGGRTLTQFKAWTKFSVSDHRPVFVRIRV